MKQSLNIVLACIALLPVLAEAQQTAVKASYSRLFPNFLIVSCRTSSSSQKE
jgi:hypothetical protein